MFDKVPAIVKGGKSLISKNSNIILDNMLNFFNSLYNIHREQELQKEFSF